MAQLLFDIDEIDKTAVALTAEQIGEMNPQCGPMRQLDYVIWHDEGAHHGLGVKAVRHDEFWIPYHVPGRPLMPGVLMIEAAAQMCSLIRHLRLDGEGFLGFTRCDDVRFRGMVTPGDTMYILAKEASWSRRRFVCKTQGLVDDKLVFEAQITGMAI